jgi:hypothetical protein
MSVPQIETNAKSIGDFFGASLVSDQVTRCDNNNWLPTVSVVLANNDLQTGRTDLIGDQVGKLHCTSTFFDHGKVSKKEATPLIRPWNSEGSVNEYG